MGRKKAPGGPEQLKKMADARRKRELGRGRTLHPLWYQAADPDAAAQSANEAMTSWLLADQRRLYDMSYWAMLYSRSRLGYSGILAGLDRTKMYTTRSGLPNSMAATFNGCKVVVDSQQNIITKDKPVARFAASDGNWKSHKIAKMRGRFIAGWFKEAEIYKKSAVAQKDSGIFGRGVVHVYAKNGRAVAERVFVGDLFVNQGSCVTNQEPLEMGRIRLMDRHEAWMMFEGDPEAQAAVMEAEEEHISVDSALSTSDDVIQLHELWRLPSYRGAGDGRHLIATRTKACLCEEWKRPNFPFAFVDFCSRPFGYWPSGVIEDLKDLQLQYNDISFAINEAIELGGGFKLFVGSDSNLVIENVDNSIGSILRGSTGGRPESLLWQLIQPELYQRLEKIERLFFAQSGQSQAVATPDPEREDPKESGIAIRSRVAINDERHALWTTSYQDFHLTLAKLAIQTIEEINEAEKEQDPEFRYEVYSVKGPQADPIDFAELGFEENEQYVIDCLPIGQLPDTIEGRIALAQEFVNAGWYDENTAREVFLSPYDVNRVETLFNASYDYFEMILDEAVESGRECPDPEGNDNLQLALQMALKHLAYAKLRRVSQENCDKVRNYIVKVKALLLSAQPPAPPAGPLANPQAPPTSGLIPNPNAAPAGPQAQAA